MVVVVVDLVVLGEAGSRENESKFHFSYICFAETFIASLLVYIVLLASTLFSLNLSCLHVSHIEVLYT